MRKLAISLFVVLLIGGLNIGAVFAAEYPDEPVTLVVPFNVGGSNDIGARTVQPYLKEYLGAPSVIVENKSGGAGVIGTGVVAKRKADGYTVLYNGCDAMVMGTLLVEKTGYKIEDFAPIYMVTTDPRYFFVRKDSPYKTFDDFVADVRKRPGKVSVAAIPGTGGHFYLMWVLQKLNLKVNFVGYPGGGPSTAALLGGHVDAYCDAGTGRVGVREKVRALATALDTPSPQWPEATPMIETKAFKEAGIKKSPGFETAITTTMWVRKEVKENFSDRYQKLSEAFEKVSKDKKFQEKAEQLGMDKVLVWLPPTRVEEILADTIKLMHGEPKLVEMLKKK
jgi:tripartite-type tricarboxylate transporter receptor subunit TctC